MRWWDELSSSGPALGYFPNAKKCWLITKPEKEEEARAFFGETAIAVITVISGLTCKRGERVKLCGFYVRPTSPVGVLFKNTSRHH